MHHATVICCHGNTTHLFSFRTQAMMHQSLSGSTANNQNSGLAAEVENITERLSSEPGDSSTAIAFQMHQIAERISRQEQKAQQQKVKNLCKVYTPSPDLSTACSSPPPNFFFIDQPCSPQAYVCDLLTWSQTVFCNCTLTL